MQYPYKNCKIFFEKFLEKSFIDEREMYKKPPPSLFGVWGIVPPMGLSKKRLVPIMISIESLTISAEYISSS